jgi:3'-5' exoribonuclease 1
MAAKEEDVPPVAKCCPPTNDRSHSIYKRLSTLNGQMNRLKPTEVREKLKELSLSDEGRDIVIYKRYKHHFKRNLIASDPCPPYELARILNTNPSGLHYLLVLDFEATCEKVNPQDYIHEIIEFPVLLFEVETLKIVDKFHSYCRPFLNPNLSTFCIELTGIQQSQVDSAPSFSDVFEAFLEWIKSKELGTKYNFSLVTDCPWDIKNCLFPQCALANVTFPSFASKWIDMRKLFSSFYQTPSGNLSNMLDMLGMSFEGREHNGMDDSRNIVRVLHQLIKDGCVLHYNRFISKDLIDSIFKS